MAGVRKGRGRELGRETTREGEGSFPFSLARPNSPFPFPFWPLPRRLELMGSASSRPSSYNQSSNQSFQSRGFRSRFGDAVCYNCGRKGILIIFAALNLILEILVVEAVDKFFARIEVKMLLIGNLSSRETEVRPCLVIKWTRDGGFESCRAESKFIARIVLICKYKYEITIKVLLQLMAHKKATKLTSFYVQKKCSRLQSSFAFNQRTSVVGGGGGICVPLEKA